MSYTEAYRSRPCEVGRLHWILGTAKQSLANRSQIFWGDLKKEEHVDTLKGDLKRKFLFRQVNSTPATVERERILLNFR